ncbi:MAG TPA: L-threonylcarbamoyladenylate synthase [Spirochaetota bacterium]|nr:L-threonylcarbamoyladenylate synthase [Spirochaetota bacterium]
MKKIVKILQKGGIVALPTDTVPGLAVDPENSSAVARIYSLKKRAENKPLLYMTDSIPMLEQLVFIPEQFRPLLDKYWPGALTVIFPLKEKKGTLGARIPAVPEIRDLIRLYGKPLAVTSANLSGTTPMQNIQDVKKKFRNKIDFYFDFPVKNSRTASTIVDISRKKMKILRQGDIIPAFYS